MSPQTVSLEIPSRRLDGEGAKKLLADADSLRARGVKRVVIDLSEVHRIDSLGINALCAVSRRMGTDARVVLAGLTDTARTLARLTRMHEVFEIFATKNAAIAALGA